MTWFKAFRGDFGFAYYGEKRTPVTFDVQMAIAVYACVLVSIATIIAAIGIRGKERWYTLFRAIFSLAVGTTIILSSVGYCWQYGTTSLKSTYIYRSEGEFKGTLGIFVGLRKINITLSGTFNGTYNDVNYNEEVELGNVHGPIKELRHCLKRGLPLPVLHLVEYLSTDEGGLRWGRRFNQAGYLAHILLWTSFAFWILANIMLVTVVFYGAFLLTLTGITMILSVVTFHVLQPKLAFRILGSEMEFVTSYGPCLWAILVFGILTTLIGFIIVCLDYKVPKTAAKYILMEKPFVKEEVFTSEHRKSIAISQIKFDVKKSPSDPSGLVNRGYESNETCKENVSERDIEHTMNNQIKRCSTLPGSISTHSDPSHRHRNSFPSLTSIHEIESESKESDQKETKQERYGLTHINVAKDDTSRETEEVNRLKDIYIDMEMSHTSVQQTFNHL